MVHPHARQIGPCTTCSVLRLYLFGYPYGGSKGTIALPVGELVGAYAIAIPVPLLLHGVPYQDGPEQGDTRTLPRKKTYFCMVTTYLPCVWNIARVINEPGIPEHTNIGPN